MTDEFLVESQRIAEALYAGIQQESNYSARSLQAQEFRVGVSDLGFCPERTRRMLDQQVPDDTDMLAAWIGTELGAGMERVAKKVWPEAILQSEVFVDLDGVDSGRTYTLTGHPDIILPEQGVVIDGKTDYGLANVERSGPSKQQNFQRHLYALGAFRMGMLNVPSLDNVRVANVWLDRAGIDKRLHCDLEPFDYAVVEEAADWLDDVVYHFLQDEEAEKVPPRDMCAVVCGFYNVCRSWDTDVQGLIEDPEALTAVELYREGLQLEKDGKRLKNQAKQHLVGIEGSTGEFLVRWTHVNDSIIPEQHRRGYSKLEVRELPRPKRKAAAE
jgi:hypothetical protein